MIVLATGIAEPASASCCRTCRILRPPRTGLARRRAQTTASTGADVRRGETFGRRERSSSPAAPWATNRSSHLLPVLRLTPNRRHSSAVFAPGCRRQPRRHDRLTNTGRSRRTSWAQRSYTTRWDTITPSRLRQAGSVTHGGVRVLPMSPVYTGRPSKGPGADRRPRRRPEGRCKRRFRRRRPVGTLRHGDEAEPGACGTIAMLPAGGAAVGRPCRRWWRRSRRASTRRQGPWPALQPRRPHGRHSQGSTVTMSRTLAGCCMDARGRRMVLRPARRRRSGHEPPAARRSWRRASRSSSRCIARACRRILARDCSLGRRRSSIRATPEGPRRSPQRLARISHQHSSRPVVLTVGGR